MDTDWLLGEKFPAKNVKSPGHLVELEGRFGSFGSNTASFTQNLPPPPKTVLRGSNNIPSLGNQTSEQTVKAMKGQGRKRTRRKRRYGPGGATFLSKLGVPSLFPSQHLGTVGMWI